MKYLILVIAVLLMMGCSKTTSERTHDYILPTGLEHCKVYNMTDGHVKSLTVVHCPDSTTSTTHSCGKSCIRHTTVISE